MNGRNEFVFIQEDGKRWLIGWESDDPNWKGTVKDHAFNRLMASPRAVLKENRRQGGRRCGK